MPKGTGVRVRRRRDGLVVGHSGADAACHGTGPRQRHRASGGRSGRAIWATAPRPARPGRRGRAVRATALGALDRLGALTDADLERALGDADPTVRRRACELAASRPAGRRPRRAR